VRAIWVILAARSRRQWRAWLLLTLLVAIGTGVVLSAVTAGRRADSAFPAYVAAHGYDAIVYTSEPPAHPLATLPDVTQVVAIGGPFYGTLTCSCGKQIDQSELGVREVAPAALSRMAKLVGGRMPDQSDPDEVLASYTLQRDYGIGPGTLIQIPMAAPSQWPQIQASINGEGPPPVKALGPVFTLRITGIVAAENEFPSGQGVTYDLYPTAAFAAATEAAPHYTFYNVRLRHGEADFARFEATVSGTDGAGVEDLDGAATAITASIHPQAVAWYVVAALAALTILVVTGQAIGRQAAADDADGPVLAALGLRSGQFAALNLLRTLAIAVTGAAAGIGVATLLSALTPVGEARLATPTPGLVFDGPVAAAGAAAAVAAVVLLGLPPALRSARQHTARHEAAVARPSRITRAAAAAGLPAAAVLGIRHAFDRGRGAAAAPVRIGLAGAAAAVTALCAIAVFGTSLSHLLASPELYGAPYQAAINSGTGARPPAMVISDLRSDHGIDRITNVTGTAISIGKISVRAVEATPVRGAMLLSASAGRLPASLRPADCQPAAGQLPGGCDEIALGSATLRSTGTHIGGTVQVTVAAPDGTPRTKTLRVVGTLPLSSDFGTGGLGDGAALSAGAYQAAQCPAALAAAPLRKCQTAASGRPVDLILVHAVPGPAGAAALARQKKLNLGNTEGPQVPTALASFGESANFPLLVAIVVAIAGVAALAHLMAVSVGRRRRESSLLKALGFVRRQLAATVFWQALAVDVVGIAVGVPLGIVLGRAVWRVFAGNLGVVPFTVYPGWLLAAIAAGFLVTSLVIAAWPARTAARSPASRLLRAE
jgi:hypothetical protein